MLRNDVFLSASGPANIRCFGSEEYVPDDGTNTKIQLFLIGTKSLISRNRKPFYDENNKSIKLSQQ